MSETSKISAPKVSFLRKHDRTLTFVGAIIVFATFVVKENLQEQWKGIADAEKSAQAAFAIRRDLIRIYKGQTAIAEAIGEINNADWLKKHIDDSSQGGRNTQPYINELYFQDLLPVSRGQVDIADELLEQLPANDELSKESDELLKRMHAMWDAIGNAENEELRNHNVPRDPYALFISPKDEELFSNTLPAQINKFVQAVLDYAKGVREQNDRRAQKASFAAIVLFSLGWGLGLVGKLFGKDLTVDVD